MPIPGYNFLLTLLIALLHCITGNLIGVFIDDPIVSEYLFLPYSFIAGMSQFHGWDALSVILELVSLTICTAVFYPIVTRIRAYVLRKISQVPIDSDQEKS